MADAIPCPHCGETDQVVTACDLGPSGGRLGRTYTCSACGKGFKTWEVHADDLSAYLTARRFCRDLTDMMKARGVFLP